VASLVVLGVSDAATAGTISRNVTLPNGFDKRSISLPVVSKKTVYRVSVTGPKAAKVTVDLRGKAGSITSPGIFTSTTGKKRIRIYTYRPLAAGRYLVVLEKVGGPAAKVTLKVTAKPAKPPKTTS
jgi:hypothetical protein